MWRTIVTGAWEWEHRAKTLGQALAIEAGKCSAAEAQLAAAVREGDALREALTEIAAVRHDGSSGDCEYVLGIARAALAALGAGTPEPQEPGAGDDRSAVVSESEEVK